MVGSWGCWRLPQSFITITSRTYEFMSQDQEKQKELAKQRVEEVLSNTHDSLKWSWQVVMGFALYNAVQEVYIAFKGTNIHKLTHDHLLYALVSLLVFIPTFIRFFYGDNRYLDIHYSELRRRWQDLNSYVEVLDTKLSRGRRLIDVLLLLSHGILFAFLSCSISNPEVFFWFYLVLLLTNCFWLYTTKILNRKVSTTGTDETITVTQIVPKRDETLTFWLNNNLCHIGFLGLFLLLFYHTNNGNQFLCIIAMIVCCTSNSFFDFCYQRGFYLPNLSLQFRKDHGDL
jgi:hypothetical protein